MLPFVRVPRAASVIAASFADCVSVELVAEPEVAPFELNVTVNLSLYRRIMTPAAPAFHPGLTSDPPPPRFAIAGTASPLAPPDSAVPKPTSLFRPAPPEPYINVVPEISELIPAPPLILFPGAPAPPPPPAGYKPVPVPPSFAAPLVPPTALFVTALYPPAAVTEAN